MRESVILFDETLEFRTLNGTHRVHIAEISCVDRCHLSEEATQGDEEFHIVHLADDFWLVGPFVTGGIKAFEDLIAAHPDTPVRDVTIGHVPWAFRKVGWFGLRLFPTPGFVNMPIDRLSELRLSVTE